MPKTDDLPARIFQRVRRSRLRRPSPVVADLSLARRWMDGAATLAVLIGLVSVWAARALRERIVSAVIGRFLLLSSRLEQEVVQQAFELADARFQRHSEAGDREAAREVARDMNELDPEMPKKVAAWAKQAKKLARHAEDAEAVDRVVSRAAVVSDMRNTIVHGYQGTTAAALGLFGIAVECGRYSKPPKPPKGRKGAKGYKSPVEEVYPLRAIREAGKEVETIQAMVCALGEIIVWGLDDLPGEEVR